MTGWTIEHIYSLPFIEITELLDYWADNPPVHIMVRAYLGIKPRVKKGTLNKYEEAALAKGTLYRSLRFPTT